MIPRLVRRQNLCGMCERMLLPSFVLVCLLGTRRERFSIFFFESGGVVF